jgi:hypothetical protein
MDMWVEAGRAEKPAKALDPTLWAKEAAKVER